MITENDRVECRKVQTKMLDAVDTLCKKHGLTYWLDFGTLLGALRHKGFIAWDDDIDVSMPMKDYKKFLAIAEKELPRDIFLQTPKTDPAYKQSMAKLRDCYSTFIEHHESDKNTYHKGIYIDIFPSVYYPKMPRLLRKVLLYAIVRSRYKAIVTKKDPWFNYPVYFVFKGIFLLFTPFMTNEVGQTPEDNGYYYSIPDHFIYPLKDIEFEEKMYPAPHNTHEYLTRMYNEKYMTPPPPEQRVPHAKVILLDTPCEHPRAMTRTKSA